MQLTKLFNPNSIAVVGASNNQNSLGGQVIRHLQENGYMGKVYPVNQRHGEIQGLKCYSSISDIPHDIDLALIIIRAQLVEDVIKECGKRNIRHAIVYSAGFSELGKEGIMLQEKIVKTARDNNVSFLGPNCQGIMNIPANIFAGFGSVFEARPFYSGKVSMVTQSGGFGYSAVNVAQEQGLGFNTIVSTGNEADIKSEDIIEHFIEDSETEIISAYIEGLKSPKQLLHLGKKALAKQKPFLVWKVGRSEVGSKAAASHTGSMAGNVELYDALFKQTGIIPIEDIYDLIDFSAVYEQKKLPKGKRLGIVTVSGGAGVLASDKSSECGLEIPQLNSDARKELAKVIPEFASTMNPIDVTAQLFNEPQLLKQALEIIVKDENIDMLMILNANMHGELGADVARSIVEVSEQTDKPIVVSWSARDHLNERAYSLLERKSIPNFKTPVRGVQALSNLSYFAESIRKKNKEKSFLSIDERIKNETLALVERLTIIPTEYEAKNILNQYGITAPPQQLTKGIEEACNAAKIMGYPVVIKVMSSELLHKTEANAVKVNIRDEKALRKAYEEVIVNVQKYDKNIEIDGVLVTPMIKDSVECILGIQNDPQFGPAIMFGLGGVYTEVLKDINFRIPPITYEEAFEMVKEIKSYPILGGVRGNKASDVEALVNTIVRLSMFAHDYRDHILELDINPLFVLPKGKGVVVGDALIVPTKNAEMLNR